jgi:hypothetical protein
MPTAYSHGKAGASRLEFGSQAPAPEPTLTRE